jgi:hypothetical protein
MDRMIGIGVMAMLAVWMVGCSTYRSGYRFTPAPASVEVSAPQTTGDVTLLGTVVGVRSQWAKSHPETVEVRLLVDNNTRETVTVDPSRLVLRSADLSAFAQPVAEVPGLMSVAAGQEGQLSVFFPIEEDAGDFRDLAGLSLRVPVRVGEMETVRSVSFSRRIVERYYYRDPWGYGYPSFYGSYGYGPYGRHRLHPYAW